MTHQTFGLINIVLLVSLVSACGGQDGSQPAAETTIQFVDVAAASGLDFVHWNGMTGERYFVEPVGAGGALADFDNDGDLDVFLLQGQLLNPAKQLSDAVIPAPAGPLRGRLYRNDLNTRHELQFTDVTEPSGLNASGYGMGVASGDYDNDGRIDLYITNFGANQLWRNISTQDQIMFTEVTASAGVDDKRWSTSASFTDIDADGWLDLYVANYVDFRLENHKACQSPNGRPNYCGPQAYNGEPDRVFYNRGDGTFADITGPLGVLDAPSSGLGVVAADLDLDGRTDIYVANDLRRNFLWRNESTDGRLQLTDIALLSGSAVAMDGRAQASMGVVAGDIDNDGDDDLFMTHLSEDTNTLYRNNGQAVFEDASAASGLGGPSTPMTGFGTALIDVDNDGWLDLVAANGAVTELEEQLRAGSVYPLAQPNQLFLNQQNGMFSDISGQAGDVFALLEVSRGIAIGDVDNDGRSDILLSNNNGPARLLLNRSENDNHWLGLRLLTETGRDAVGANISLRRADGTVLWRRAATDGSYLCASDPRVLIGLGSQDGAVAVDVHWPGGKKEQWPNLAPDQYHTLQMGQGQTLPAARP